jgi:hypothetical protein
MMVFVVEHTNWLKIGRVRLPKKNSKKMKKKIATVMAHHLDRTLARQTGPFKRSKKMKKKLVRPQKV